MRRTIVMLLATAFAVWLLQAGVLDRTPGVRPSPSPERSYGYSSHETATLCPLISESSGLMLDDDGLVWTVNDGPDPILYRVGEQGRCRPSSVVGASLFDWEALARDNTHLYIGDIGDNRAVRPSISVLAVPLRSLSRSPRVVARYPFVYPGGPRDAEAMFVDPRDGNLYIVTKSDRPIVYRAPLDSPDAIRDLERVARLRINDLLPGPTGADMSTTGRLVFATYGGAYLFEVGDRSLATVLRRRPRRIPLPVVAQREAIVFDRDGFAFLWTSEGSNAPLFRTAPGG